MRNTKPKPVKQIKFEHGKLYQRTASTLADNTYEVIELGTILTRKGGLTRQQKIYAVANDGNWIDI